MKRFYICENNGITAVVDQEVWDQIREWQEREQFAENGGSPNLSAYPGPIFTFSDFIGLRGLVTGDMGVFEEFTEGQELVEANLYVPFSNLGGDINVLSHDDLLAQVKARPAMKQILDTFDLIRTLRMHRSVEPSDKRQPVTSV